MLFNDTNTKRTSIIYRKNVLRCLIAQVKNMASGIAISPYESTKGLSPKPPPYHHAHHERMMYMLTVRKIKIGHANAFSCLNNIGMPAMAKSIIGV